MAKTVYYIPQWALDRLNHGKEKTMKYECYDSIFYSISGTFDINLDKTPTSQTDLFTVDYMIGWKDGFKDGWQMRKGVDL